MVPPFVRTSHQSIAEQTPDNLQDLDTISYTTGQDFIFQPKVQMYKLSKHHKGAICFWAIAALDCNDVNDIVSTPLYFWYSLVTPKRFQTISTSTVLLITESFRHCLSEHFTGDHFFIKISGI